MVWADIDDDGRYQNDQVDVREVPLLVVIVVVRVIIIVTTTTQSDLCKNCFFLPGFPTLQFSGAKILLLHLVKKLERVVSQKRIKLSTRFTWLQNAFFS